MTSAEINLGGVFRPDSFADWICHRARLLDLKGWVTVQGASQMCIFVQGPQVLIDAMEMACSLGPMDAAVARIEVLPKRHNDQLSDFRKL